MNNYYYENREIILARRAEYYKENKELAEKRKKAYQARHKKDLETGDPRRPGFLSYYLLWNQPTLEASLREYQKKYPDL